MRNKHPATKLLLPCLYFVPFRSPIKLDHEYCRAAIVQPRTKFSIDFTFAFVLVTEKKNRYETQRWLPTKYHVSCHNYFERLKDKLQSARRN